ncbi:RDD family protein [Mycobacterium sp. MFM001]|uniref:RDD family protein n=1 Tax=Mycobacterium sp. MFM001 TaxID=2049453 RepID=UPI000DA4B032|nr:RDD family protein [Mycobacterium sp. MFM001]GBE66677.1 RDD family protein [Mycobacterium sp. MFM001]
MTTPQPDPNSPQYGYPPPPSDRRPGGLGERFFARLIDGIIVNIVAFVLSLFMLDKDYWFLVTGLFSGVLMFSYFVLFEVTQGSSPGKKLLGLAVRGAGGAPRPDAKQSAIRNAFTLLAVVPYFGGLLAFIAYVVIAATISSSPTKQGKHDELAGGTQVVKR